MSAWVGVHPGLQPVAAVSEADGAAIAGARAAPLQRATAPRTPGTRRGTGGLPGRLAGYHPWPRVGGGGGGLSLGQ
eukprot:scaffold105068_cov28-Phaeocystis_antarctica.AAC.1